MRPRFLGPVEMDNEGPASPINHLHAGAPPFLVAWGERDFPHLVRQALDFVDGLRRHSIDANTVVLKDCDHLDASYATGKVNGAWILSATQFMNSQVG